MPNEPTIEPCSIVLIDRSRFHKNQFKNSQRFLKTTHYVLEAKLKTG